MAGQHRTNSLHPGFTRLFIDVELDAISALYWKTSAESKSEGIVTWLQSGKTVQFKNSRLNPA